MLNKELIVKALNKAKIAFNEGCSTVQKHDVIQYVSKSGKSVMMFFENNTPAKSLNIASIKNGLNTVRKNYSQDFTRDFNTLSIKKTVIGATGGKENSRAIVHQVGSTKRPYRITNRQTFVVKNTPIYKTTTIG